MLISESDFNLGRLDTLCTNENTDILTNQNTNTNDNNPIYHLESKRVENLVFSQEIGGENGIFSKKRLSGDFGIFSNSTV